MAEVLKTYGSQHVQATRKAKIISRFFDLTDYFQTCGLNAFTYGYFHVTKYIVRPINERWMPFRALGRSKNPGAEYYYLADVICRALVGIG